MKRMLDKILRYYGSRVIVHTQTEQIPVHAFLQPVNSKSWQNMNHMHLSGGEVPRGQFLYIGPVEVPVLGCEYLQLSDKRYRVRRCDTLMIGDEPLYRWALCVEGGYDEPWKN